MSEQNNGVNENSIIFPIELDPFPFHSSATRNINGKLHIFTENKDSSKSQVSQEVKENKLVEIGQTDDKGNNSYRYRLLVIDSYSKYLTK